MSKFNLHLISRTISKDTGLLLLRLIIGGFLIYHGQGKVFGDMGKFTGTVAKLGFPMPEFFAWAAALSEFLGGIFVVVGIFTQFTALMVIITMAVAAFGQHAGDAFSKKELSLVYMGIMVALFFTGAGSHSVDARLLNNERETSA